MRVACLVNNIRLTTDCGGAFSGQRRGRIERPKNPMTKPSEKSLSVAEDLLDYVHPGMPRAAALHEVAQMVDEMNSELVETVSALIVELESSRPGSHTVLLTHLKHLLADYKPWRAESKSQHELFSPETTTVTQAGTVAGQMP